jgi:DNA-binding CsgD family transcriptional regulator
MRGEANSISLMLDALVEAIKNIGSETHVDSLVDLIGASVKHDRVTVVRYSSTQRPEFISHRNFDDALVNKYLKIYYVHDPFYAHWRNNQKPGIFTLRDTTRKKRSPYILEFLSESVISDEVGVLLDDGANWCLGIFLDRSAGKYTRIEIMRVEAQFKVFAALHALDIQARAPNFKRTKQPTLPGAAPTEKIAAHIPQALWPTLTEREREVVQLVLSGYPSQRIARKLGIAQGTVKNHRRRIYDKLDITTERELFLQFIEATTS